MAEFSAFKETSFKNDLVAILTEGEELKKWSEFKEEALKVSGDYNVRWLKTEFNQTVATAKMAERWKEFEADADLYPNLEYVAVRDGRTREQHLKWDGLIAPINDPIWDKILPPNDWGCRCDVVQTDEEENVTACRTKKRLNNDDNKKCSENVKEEFSNNPAKSGKIFKESAYIDRLGEGEISDAEIEALVQLSKHSDTFVRAKAFEKFYDIVPIEKQFKEIIPNVFDHILNKHKNDYDSLVLIADKLNSEPGYLLPTPNRKDWHKFYKKFGATPPIEFKNPDVYCGKFIEHEGFTTGNLKKATSNMIKRGRKQCDRLVIEDSSATNNFIKKIANAPHKYIVNELYVIKNGKIVKVI